MAGRYDRDFNLDFSKVAKPARPIRRRRDPIADMMDLGSQWAPAVGTALGGIAGGVAGAAGGPLGILAGASSGATLGNSAGQAVGVGLGGMSDLQRRDENERLQRQRDEDAERAAQHNAVLRMVQGLG